MTACKRQFNEMEHPVDWDMQDAKKICIMPEEAGISKLEKKKQKRKAQKLRKKMREDEQTLEGQGSMQQRNMQQHSMQQRNMQQHSMQQHSVQQQSTAPSMQQQGGSARNFAPQPSNGQLPQPDNSTWAALNSFLPPTKKSEARNMQHRFNAAMNVNTSQGPKSSIVIHNSSLPQHASAAANAFSGNANAGFVPKRNEQRNIPPKNNSASLSTSIPPGSTSNASVAASNALGTSRIVTASSRIAPGSTRVAPGSTRVAPGSTRIAPGSTRIAPGSASNASVAASNAPGTSRIAPGTSRIAPGTSRIAPGSTSNASVAASNAPGTSKIAPGTSRIAPGSTSNASVAASNATGTSRFAPGSTRIAPGSTRIAPGLTSNAHVAPNNVSVRSSDAPACTNNAPVATSNEPALTSTAPLPPVGDKNDPTSFESLQSSVSPTLMNSIRKLGFSAMREIQARTIPHLLQGKNLRGTAATGSGKTLAFIIPLLERLNRLNFKPGQGLGALILSPTRELALQILEVLKKLMQGLPYTHGIIMGGTNMKKETAFIISGVNIIVATPGRLLDHLQHTPQFSYQNLKCLVMDEADMILATGFEPQMKQILRILPENRQTMLFSATRGGKVETLVYEALGNVYEEVDVVSAKPSRLNSNVTQEYVCCPTYNRSLMLYKILDQNRDRKVMVFLSLCHSVKFYDSLLNILGITVSCIHGRMTQSKRSAMFKEFQESSCMTLICTDVASRGWDIPLVDLILQVDPPSDASEFVHRVGRAAREVGSTGRAVLFLRPEELGYLTHLQGQHKTKLKELVILESELPPIQSNIHMAVINDKLLHVKAKKLAKIHWKGYSQLKPSQYFNKKTLSIEQMEMSYGVINGLPRHIHQAALQSAENIARRRQNAAN